MRNKAEAARNSLILTAYKTYRLSIPMIAHIFNVAAGEARKVIASRTRLDGDVKHNGA